MTGFAPSGAVATCLNQTSHIGACSQLLGYEVLTEELLKTNENCESQRFNENKEWDWTFTSLDHEVITCLFKNFEKLPKLFKEMAKQTAESGKTINSDTVEVIKTSEALKYFEAILNSCLFGLN